jgi:ElaB/YqjD/DUF883 family membrane-anchored ribosome-binding protein
MEDLTMNGTTQSQAAKEKLVRDFRAVVTDTEELLKATANQAGERVTAVRARVEERLAESKKQLSELERGIEEKTKAAARATDDMVRQHPWQSVGIAATIGFLAGMLTSRRS